MSTLNHKESRGMGVRTQKRYDPVTNNRKYENLVKFNYLGERARKNFKTSGNKQKKENNGYLEIKLEAGRGDRGKIF